MKKECFVIQPISDPKFTKRYEDIYKPAIEAVDLFPYRVDLDLGVIIPIDEIESRINDSMICFADISVDNPNVWYELGYAFALNKDVVMVCDETRKDFPFDVRHKYIIKYNTDSPSDFDTLKKKLIEKIKASLKTQKTTEKILEHPIKETNGLQPYELSLLAFIIGEQSDETDCVTAFTLKNRMSKAGYSDVVCNISLRMLRVKKLITSKQYYYNGDEYPAYTLSDIGEEFILKNTHLFDLAQARTEETNPIKIEDSEELPF